MLHDASRSGNLLHLVLSLSSVGGVLEAISVGKVHRYCPGLNVRGWNVLQWAGQLGDGRAISLGEAVGPDGKTYELQLKVCHTSVSVPLEFKLH